ncbi:MAG: glycoside hydrolase family 6 protein [Gaiellaceae bacterium]
MRKTKRTLWSFGAIVMLAIVATMALATTGSASTATRSLDPGTRFFVPMPDKGAIQQGVDLLRKHDFKDAALLATMVSKGHAVWFDKGTPADVQRQVRQTMLMAALQRSVPVLVAYDLPFRDCGQYSAGGALNTADYLAWIDGFARGIGNGKAVVILEPDGIGIVPYNIDINGNMEWCQPDLTGTGLADGAAANQARWDQLNGAVDRLEKQPNVSVYLDGTHSDWLGVPDIAQRLVKAGVERAQGFFLNVSNYQWTGNLIQYGTWVSKCIAQPVRTSDTCANKFWNGGPDGTMIASLLGPWTGVTLSSAGQWSDTSSDPTLNTSGINARLAGQVGTTHFVVDTSRNAQGPWTPTAGKYSGDPQVWCNPPGRGVGDRPTANTGTALLDAKLWIKVPGESDGQCNRSISGSTTDPEWGGIVDPAAGQWFPQMALQLVQNASPKLIP